MYIMKRKNRLIAVLLFAALLGVLTGCTKASPFVKSDIDRIDLSVAADAGELSYLYEAAVVDDSREYLAHPDSILLNDGSIMTFYPAGHGRGAIQTRISYDGGLSWQKSPYATPVSWEDSQETPTVYRLQFQSGTEKLILVSANPKWEKLKGDGFNVSVSDDDGKSWTEFEKFYGKGSEKSVSPIVAMSSLVRLKENGEFVDRWMGVFHDHNFVNYKTILSFDESGSMSWTTPTPYFSSYRSEEKDAKMCEVLIIRSDEGTGDELCLIARSNGKNGKKYRNSLVSFSSDEGETWSRPTESVSALNGERHKAVYSDGRLFVTFRSIERDDDYKKYRAKKKNNWYSEGYVAWVGTYEDIKNGADGQYRIKLAHTYLDGQKEPQISANADTGYCGNVLLPDGTIVTTSYGIFSPDSDKTYIISKRIRLADIDLLFASKK